MSRRGVAAFDFDRTVTERDTLLPFLRRVGGPLRFARGVLGGAPALVERNSEDRRRRAKVALLRSTLGGRSIAELEAEAVAYAASFESLYRDESLARIAFHRDEGHQLVLVTASLRLYTEPAARMLGFDHVIAVDLEVDDGGRVTGDIVGPNVRGPEKAARLSRWMGTTDTQLWAYGDSSGDTEMLAMADHPTWVGRKR